MIVYRLLNSKIQFGAMTLSSVLKGVVNSGDLSDQQGHNSESSVKFYLVRHTGVHPNQVTPASVVSTVSLCEFATSSSLAKVVAKLFLFLSTEHCFLVWTIDC